MQERFHLDLRLTWVRLLLVGGSSLGYLSIFLLFYQTQGLNIAALSILPIVIAGWYFGLKVGFLAGVISFLVHSLLFRLLLDTNWLDIISHGAPGYLAAITVGTIVGRLHDLDQRLEQELVERHRVEAALRESETYIRTLVDQSPFSTQIFRPDGSVISINPAFCTFWSATPEAATYIVNYYNILQDEQLKATGLMPFIQSGFAGTFTELPEIWYDPQQTESVKRTGLKPKWVIGYIWPIKNKNGEVQQVVLMHQDITERKQVEVQRLELALTKERANLLKDILNNLSHDLKTPLTVINTSLYLLEKSTDPEYQKGKLDNLKTQVQHLDKLIRDILATSYLDTVPELPLMPLDPHLIIERVREQFSAIAESQTITIDLQLDNTLPQVRANEAELQRVLMNLVENALHYTPNGGHITIRTFVQAEEVAVEVTDTGIGIETEDLPHIFESFYRADKARATDKGGTGLGLAIVKKIVEKHHGRIEVDTIPGKGSTFRVWLPGIPIT